MVSDETLSISNLLDYWSVHESEGKNEEEEIEADINLLDHLEEHSVFLNPIKFCIMVELTKQPDILSADLRKTLGVSWGRFLAAINSLVDENLIIYTTEFNIGQQRRMVSISNLGYERFKHFVTNLVPSIM